MKIRLIVGLANPGKEYAATRHNAGSWYINLIVNKLNILLQEESRFYGFTSFVSIANVYMHLLIPTTFMNSSGKSVAAIAKFYHIEPNEILIAHDDISFPPGIVRLKFGGSHGGHNGLKDITRSLGNNSNYYRLRIGIGYPEDKKKFLILY